MHPLSSYMSMIIACKKGESVFLFVFIVIWPAAWSLFYANIINANN